MLLNSNVEIFSFQFTITKQLYVTKLRTIVQVLFASQESHIHGINMIGNCRLQMYVDKSDLSIST